MPSGFYCDLDITKATEGLTDLEKTQLPFAVAKMLTMTAQAGKEAVQSTVQPGQMAPMMIRNPWTSRSIRIKPADKGKLPMQAVITADSSNGKSPDYLGLQDTGGEKVPHKGHTHIAVPSDYLMQIIGGKQAIIPDELRARNLLGAVGGRFTRIKRSGKMKGQIALVNQRIVRGSVFFLQTVGGVDTIMGRKPTGRTASVFYWLVPEAKIEKAFPFETLCRNAIEGKWKAIWEQVWSGIRIKGIKF